MPACADAACAALPKNAPLPPQHNWASGQDQARSIKAQLTSLCPGLKVWLDVDNMRTKAGTSATDKESFEKLINGVQVMTAILAGSVREGKEYSDYFRSVPCQHELGRAIQNNTPVVFVIETDPNHGGISLEAHQNELRAMIEEEEIKEERSEEKAKLLKDILLLLDRSKVVEWHRIRTYQDISLKLILQEFLHKLAAARSNDIVYLRREVAREPLLLQPPGQGLAHLYVSQYNVGAAAFVNLLSGYYRASGLQEQRSTTRLSLTRGALSFSRRSAAGKPVSLVTTSDVEQMHHASHFLCYLNKLTHTSGEVTAAFHVELEYALQQDMHILLVHEARKEADGTTFKAIIDATPEPLKWDSAKRAKRLYKELAIMICGSEHGAAEAHLNVGLHLLLNAAASSSQRPTQTTTSVRSQLVYSDAQTSEPAITKMPAVPVAPDDGGKVTPLHEKMVGLEERNGEQEDENARQQKEYALQQEAKIAEQEDQLAALRAELEAAQATATASITPLATSELANPPRLTYAAQAPMDTLRALGTSLAALFVRQELQTNRQSASEEAASVRV